MKKLRRIETYEVAIAYWDENGIFVDKTTDGGIEANELEEVAYNILDWCEEKGYTFQWIDYTPVITYQLVEE